MVKTCSWGTCNSDTRHPDRIQNVAFIPFPKPKTNWEKCLRWVKACGRPHSQLNPANIDRHKFVCTKHFVSKDGPTEEFPDPLPADGSIVKKNRPHWRQRHALSQSRAIKELDYPPTLKNKTSSWNTEYIAPNSCLINHGAINSETSPDEGVPAATALSDFCPPLAVLSAAAEIKELQEKLKASEENLHHQKVLNQHLCLENSVLSKNKPIENNVDFLPLTVETVLKQELKFKGLFEYYCSLKYETYVKLLQFLTSETVPKIQIKRKDIISIDIQEQLFLTLMRLRHDFGLKDLGFRFGISTQAVSEILNAWIDHSYLLLGIIPIWPHRDVIIESMPPQYKSEFPSTLAIIDCTELKTEKPSSLKLKSQMHSDYKSSTILKGLEACDPMGNIIFVSELFTGSISDKEIIGKSNFLRLLEQLIEAGYIKRGDSIMADKGFTISEELQKLGLHLNLPPFVCAGCQLSQADVHFTQKIVQHRIHVERAIKKI